MLTNTQVAETSHHKNDEKLLSCQVATYRDGNLATNISALATTVATSLATNDLTALSARILGRSLGNCQATFMATHELPSSKNQATSASQNENLATQVTNKLPPHVTGKYASNNQLITLQRLIELTGKHLCASENEIIEMLEETLANHPIEEALTTFRNLANELQIKLSKSAIKNPIYAPLVSCSDCQHFIRDEINPAAGIGSCSLNNWTPSQKPLYPQTERVCKFYQPHIKN